MNKPLDMSGYDPVTDDIEKYVNKQGYTLGEKAKMLQKQAFSIEYCYVQGVITKSQLKEINERFSKQFRESLQKIEDKS